MRFGYAESKEQAIREFINKLHFRTGYNHPKDAIEAVLGAGGIPVLAHPCYGDGDQLILGGELDERVRRLIGYGLEGLEAFYSGFPEKLRREVLALADRYGLYVTAGSDYHGGNKMIRLADTGLSADAPAPEGLRRFLADAFKTQEA